MEGRRFESQAGPEGQGGSRAGEPVLVDGLVAEPRFQDEVADGLGGQGRDRNGRRREAQQGCSEDGLHGLASLENGVAARSR